MRSETTEQDRRMSRLPVPGIHSPVGDRVRIGSQYSLLVGRGDQTGRSVDHETLKTEVTSKQLWHDKDPPVVSTEQSLHRNLLARVTSL